jgi:hypothetical protein
LLLNNLTLRSAEIKYGPAVFIRLSLS